MTSRSAVGTGLAVSVNVALPPSVTPLPAAMLTSGVGGGGVASSAVNSTTTSSQTGLLWASAICCACAAVIPPPVTPVPSCSPKATSTRFQRLTCDVPCCVSPANACTFATTSGSTV